MTSDYSDLNVCIIGQLLTDNMKAALELGHRPIYTYKKKIYHLQAYYMRNQCTGDVDLI